MSKENKIQKPFRNKIIINRLLIMVMFLAVAISLSSAVYAFSIDKTQYYVGEPVIITLDNFADMELSINNILRLVPNSFKSVYLTEDVGNYTLCLSNTATRQILECQNFEVLPGNNSSLIQEACISPNGIIILDRNDFKAQELFTIILDLNNTNSSLNNIILTIRNEQTFYRYLYLDNNAVSFMPYSEGFYEIFVSDEGQVIDSKIIYVKPTIININPTDNTLIDNKLNNNNILISTPSSTSKPLNIRTNKKNGLTGSIKILDNVLDKDKFDVNIDFDDSHMKKASFKGVNSDFDIGLEMPDNPVVNEYFGEPVKNIAFDPRNTSFDNGTITMIAEGTELWKCKDYNFSLQQCYGSFVKVMDIIPGQSYDIELSMQDPLWTEVLTPRCSCQDSSPAVPGAKSTAKCSVYCPINVTVLNNFSDGFIQKVSYNVTIAITTTSSGSGAHYGYFDSDQTLINGNESLIGNSTSDISITLVWTNNSIVNTTFNKANCPTWDSGYCTWYIYLNSSATTAGANKAITTNISLNKMNYTWNYTEFPPQSININLLFPTNLLILNYRNINFSYYLNSSLNITNCSLYDNETSWSLKLTNTSAVTNMSNNYFNKTFGSDGTYLWNIRCNSPNNYSFANANYTFTIDTAVPSIALMSPNASEYINFSSVVTFKFNVFDATSISNCSLYINNTYRAIQTPITMDTEQSFDYYLENGFYNWFINCTDVAGNSNVSLTRNFTVNYTQPAWTGTWYETSTQSYTTDDANINLANSRDATENNISTYVVGPGYKTIINATTPYFGVNGVLIPESTDVSFSGVFIGGTNFIWITWHLYILNSTGITQIAYWGDDSNNGKRLNPSGTVLTVSDIYTIAPLTRLLSTDKLLLVINAYNSQSTNSSVTHLWDAARSSYVSFVNWINLGFMYVDLIEPQNNLTLNQSDVFNITCDYNCTGGSCINSRIIVQYNTSNTTWTDIGASGPLILNGTQQNNVSVGNVTTYGTSLFWIRVSTSTITNIRCIATSDYSTADGTTYRQISGADAQNPSVTQVSPPNYNWTNSTTKTFIYTATDNTVVANCSLYINGLFNRSNSSIGAGNNNFTVSGFNEGNYNWSIYCFDTSGNSNMTNNRTFYVDYTKPSISLYFPDNQSTLNYNTINFNFSFNDNMSPNGTCDLYVDGALSQPNIFAIAGSFTNYTKVLNVSYHNWSVYCRDLATNFNSSLVYYFNITSQPPVIILDTPANNTWLNYSTNIILKYNLTDGGLITNCSLYLNGQYNQSNSSAVTNPGTNNFTFASMNNQKYNWSVLCFNDQNLSYQTPYYTFYVDTLNPTISLSNPANTSTITGSANINFQFNATDNLATTLKCNLTLNGVINNTSPIYATSGAITSYPINNVPDGIYSWNVSCSDNSTNKNSSYTYSFNVSVPPTVTGISPVPPPTQVFGGNVTFNYTATDNSGIVNCSLFIDNVWNQTNYSINTTSNNYFYLYNMDEYLHTWYVNCTDTSGLQGLSTARIFYIDRFPPAIDLINPGNQSQQNTSSILFIFNATDNRASQLTCNLTLDDSVVVPSIIASNGVAVNVTINNTQNGIHNWSVMCWDLAINKNVSLTYYFNVSVPPIINLTSPVNNYFTGSGNITFIYNATGSPGLDNCSLYINSIFNQSNTTAVINGALNNFTLNNIPEGKYNWSILCYDNSTSYLSTLSTTRNFTVDKTAPYMILNYPDGINNVTSNNVTFNFTAYDNYAQNMSCNIWLSDAIEWPGVTAVNGTPFVITKKLNDGLFDWYVDCNDSVNNNNISNTVNFTVEAPPNVTLIIPKQNSWNNVTNITFTYYFEDWLGFGYCDLIIDGTNVTSDSFVDPFLNNTFNYVLSEGTHNWTVNCTDTDNNVYMPQPKTFYVDITAPNISINNPQNNTNYSLGNMVFSFNVTDNVAANTTCSAIINSSSFNQLININATNNTENIFYRNLTDNYYSWYVTCNDLANNSFNTGNYYFNVSQKPTIIDLFPYNDTLTSNRNITFFFNVSDNDGLLNCSVYLDGQLNNTRNSSLTNNGRNNITVNDIVDGYHSWLIRCFDNGTYNNFNDSLTYYFSIDNTPPNILLNNPPDGNITLNDSVIFNFTAYDTISNNLTCNLTLGAVVISPFINATNGSDVIVLKDLLSLGIHYWNVTCWDQLNNTNTSLTYNFTVPMPDLMVNDSSIIFSSNNPIEFSNITINATVWNVGNSNANNITVQLFNGDPSSGIQIGNNLTINNITPGGFEIVQFNYTLGVGTLNIYLVVDPPIISNGSIKEDNESNNVVNKSITVSSWQYLLGYEQATLKMFDPIFNTLFEWNVTNNTGKIFAVDTDSNINWLNLYAISRNISDSYMSDDFYDADLKLGIENNSDSINFTYTFNDQPVQLINLTVFNRQILDIPIYNSTNNSNFITGILWDSTNSDSYNGSQDIVFVTRVNKNTVGYNDTYDFELRIPSKLRSYKGGIDTVSLYTEIN